MKINFFKYTVGIAAIAMTFMSCGDDFLDRQQDNQLSEKQVFTSYTQTNKLVTDIYSRAKTANRPLVYFNHFSSAPVTDECEASTAEQDLSNKFNNGDWGPGAYTDCFPNNTNCGQFWWDLYAYIRQTNVFLTGVEEYKTPDNPLEPGELNKRIGEVYFLRAYLHYLVIRSYGEAPYIDYKVDPQGSMEFQRESVHSMVEKACHDLDEAYKRLPDTWGTGTSQFSRADKGAALGLKALLRWVAATPLYNGSGTTYDGISNPRKFESEYKTMNPARWTAAKEAAKAVMDYKVDGNPRYSLYQKYASTDFNDGSGRNLNDSKVYTRLWQMYYDFDSFAQEGIFWVTRDKNAAWTGDVYPPSRGGSSRQMPVQEQVDEYEYIAPDGYGYPVYSSRAKSDGYDDANPYVSVKRDPRFYRDIIYHGAAFRDNSNNKKYINTATGSDAIGANNATTTGYYLRKIVKEDWNRSGDFQIHVPMIIRLAEIMLIYCEATNEVSGPTDEIYNMVNQIRTRSFMAPMPPSTKTDKNLMREYIRREKRVEFFYENKRLWDTRMYLEPTSATEMAREDAWEAAGSTNNERSQKYWPYPKCQRMINGMRPVEDATNGKIEVDGKKYRMERFFKESRVFDRKHILYPMRNGDVLNAPTIGQNPGW